jgi:hypothetical protein
MTTYVPSNYVWWVNAASQGTGIGYDIIACQINEESGFDPNAVSPAGAEGIAQFLPSTFYSYASGSPFNVNDALHAYIGFMNALARMENNDIFNMLAAYNAGPGNIAAGYGYAQTIMSCAGAGTRTGSTQLVPSLAPEGNPAAGSSSDDYSPRVKATGSNVYWAGANALSAGQSIGRL